MRRSLVLKLFKNYLFVIAVSICLLFPLASVKAEEEVVKCSITITSENLVDKNLAQPTGACKGFIEGYYVPTSGRWMIKGIKNGSVSNGETVRFFLPQPVASYAELSVKTVMKEKPAPAPKPETKPKTDAQPQPKQETKPAETATKTETKKTNTPNQGSSATKSTASQSNTTQPKQQTKPDSTKQTSTGQSNSVTKEISKSENNVTETKAASNAEELDNQNKKEQLNEDNESVKEFAKD